MTRLLVLTFGIALVIASQASAAITLYSDRASFDAATNNQTIADFNSMQSVFTFKGAAFSDSGINFTDNSFRMFILNDFYDPDPATPYLNENTSGGEITVTPGGAGVTAFAVDLGVLNETFTTSSTQIAIDITDGSGTTSYSFTAPDQPALGFFGFTTDSDIVSVKFAGDMLAMDNVTVAEAADQAAVPEPATLTIWGLGALGCAFAAYRRKRQAA